MFEKRITFFFEDQINAGDSAEPGVIGGGAVINDIVQGKAMDSGPLGVEGQVDVIGHQEDLLHVSPLCPVERMAELEFIHPEINQGTIWTNRGLD